MPFAFISGEARGALIEGLSYRWCGGYQAPTRLLLGERCVGCGSIGGNRSARCVYETFRSASSRPPLEWDGGVPFWDVKSSPAFHTLPRAVDILAFQAPSLCKSVQQGGGRSCPGQSASMAQRLQPQGVQAA